MADFDFDIEWKGATPDQFARELGAVGSAVLDELEDGGSSLGNEIEGSAKRFATSGVSPGPNVITDTLRGSISNQVTRRGDSIEIAVGSNTLYAPYVELGTRRASSYPFVKPAFEDSKSRINGLMTDAVRASVGGF